MTKYDYWKTDPDHDYSGQRTYNTPEEDDLIQELKELEEKETDLEDELELTRDRICEIQEKLRRA